MNSDPFKPAHPICYALTVTTHQKEFLTELLTSLGHTNYVEGSVDCAEEIEFDYDNTQRDYYGEQKETGPFVFYSESLEDLAKIQSDIEHESKTFHVDPNSIVFHIAPIQDQNWRESWKASFVPVEISKQLILLPPWENASSYAHQYKLILDPGMAFGTGQHETTQLCLELFLALEVPAKVLDVGTGSGVLAIAAAMRGCRSILGNDIDADSIAISRENALMNQVPWICFTTDLLDEISESQFDLTFANIQLIPLKKLMPRIVAVSSNTIIFSGILNSEEDEFVTLVCSHNLQVQKIVRKNHWIGIQCKKNP